MTEALPVRLSHLLRFCAPGSIIRGDNELLVPMDTRYWVNKHGSPTGQVIQRVKRLRAALGIDQELRYPPEPSINYAGHIDGGTLPAVRFPSWMRCGNCGNLYRKPWKDQKEDLLICTNKKCKKPGGLIQLPWVLVHEKGYMDDIPWHWLAHRDSDGSNREQSQCRDYHSLELTVDNKIRCNAEKCNAFADLSQGAIYGKGFFAKYKQMQQQPWIRERVPSNEIDEATPIAVEVGDSRIYSPKTANAIVIPPESREDPDSLVSKLSSMQDEIERLRQALKRPNLLRGRINKLAGKLHCSPEEIQLAWDEIESDYLSQPEDENITNGQLYEKEYAALTNEIPDLKEKEEFVTYHYSEEWRNLKDSLNASTDLQKIIQIIDQVVSVKRLREIMIYKGFSRPVGTSEEPTIISPDLEGKQTWLPALELFGEGIFLRIKESILQAWEQDETIINRAEAMQPRKDNFYCNTILPDPTPRFILLHTLAHLIIRQLEFESGYPAAALNERLYVQEPTDNTLSPMAGILIYVSVPDKAGSLGGLAELAEPKHLLAVLESVFAHAEWCSLDPVCSEHEGQGPALLNRAACHACALIPDTSCSYSNVLLDRIFIKGSISDDDSLTLQPFLNYVNGGHI